MGDRLLILDIMNVGKRKTKAKRFLRLSPLFAVVFLLAASASGCSRRPPPDFGALETQVRNILELPAVEYVYRDIVYLGSTRSFLFFKTMDKRLLFSVRLRVRAGIDLAEGFRIVPDDSNPRRVYVRLPASRILMVDADERGIHQYFAYGERFSRMEYSAAIDAVKPKAEEDARKRGILEKSDENAKNLIRGFLGTAGFSRVDFLPARAAEDGIRG